MNTFINNAIKDLKPYIPTPHKIWELESKDNVLKLDWNESTISPSPKVKQSLQNYLDFGQLNWYPNTNNTELYLSISKYTNMATKNIEIFASSDCAHEFILQTFLNIGDIVLIVAPTYDNFRARAQGVGIKTLFHILRDDFKLDFTKLQKDISIHNPKAVYICNPNNPTGMLYDIKQLVNLIEIFPNTLFIIDEAYYEFCGESVATFTNKYNNLIVTRTFSKAFGLASFRIGYCLSSYDNIATLNKLRNPKNISSYAQIAALAALDDVEYMQKYVNEVKKSKKWFIEILRSLSIQCYKSEANFVFLALNDIKRFIEFLETHNIFIRDYSHIVENHCRITIGTLEQMKIVSNAIREFKNV